MTTLWIILAAAFAVAEMVTGTFYLLVLAVAALAGAGAAYIDMDPAGQIGVAAVVAAIGYAVLHKVRKGIKRPDVAANPDLNIDIGTTVIVASVGPDGVAVVQFRGAQWSARVDGGMAVPGAPYKIAAIDGNVLVLEKIA